MIMANLSQARELAARGVSAAGVQIGASTLERATAALGAKDTIFRLIERNTYHLIREVRGTC